MHTFPLLQQQPKIGKGRTQVLIKNKPKTPLQVLINWHKINLELYGPIISPTKTKTNKAAENEAKGDRAVMETPATTQTGKTSTELPKKETPLTVKKKKTAAKLKTTDDIGLMPIQPFTVKDDIVLPFPMMMNKQPISPSSINREIYSIPNQDWSLPSVTNILNTTMPESSVTALAIWKKKKIKEVGVEGFETFMREAKQKGKDLHTGIETHLRGVQYDSVFIESRIAGYWLSLKSVLSSIEDVVMLESFVVHPQLRYKGIVDCVARHKGTLVLIDWKTSDRRKETLKATYDDPVQLAAYIGALNADNNYPFEVKNAVLVVAYPTGVPASVLFLNQNLCEHYWQIWLQRLQKFNTVKRSQ